MFDELDESLQRSLQQGCDEYNTGIESTSTTNLLTSSYHRSRNQTKNSRSRPTKLRKSRIRKNSSTSRHANTSSDRKRSRNGEKTRHN
jgi:hypothetical protein